MNPGTPWTWVQPKDRNELLQRLEDARDLNVPERERENLCGVAHGEIMKLATLNSELLAVVSALDGFQRKYQSLTLDEMPGNSYYAGRLMDIVNQARAAIAKAEGQQS